MGRVVGAVRRILSWRAEEDRAWAEERDSWPRWKLVAFYVVAAAGAVIIILLRAWSRTEGFVGG